MLGIISVTFIVFYRFMLREIECYLHSVANVAVHVNVLELREQRHHLLHLRHTVEPRLDGDALWASQNIHHFMNKSRKKYVGHNKSQV